MFEHVYLWAEHDTGGDTLKDKLLAFFPNLKVINAPDQPHLPFRYWQVCWSDLGIRHGLDIVKKPVSVPPPSRMASYPQVTVQGTNPEFASGKGSPLILSLVGGVGADVGTGVGVGAGAGVGVAVGPGVRFGVGVGTGMEVGVGVRVGVAVGTVGSALPVNLKVARKDVPSLTVKSKTTFPDPSTVPLRTSVIRVVPPLL